MRYGYRSSGCEVMLFMLFLAVVVLVALIYFAFYIIVPAALLLFCGIVAVGIVTGTGRAAYNFVKVFIEAHKHIR